MNVVYNIPVVVHVVYSSSAMNITDAQVRSQIDVLNEDFRRLNADKSNTPSAHAAVAADVEINFCLATVDPNGNATTGITRTSTTVSSFSDNDAVKYTSSGGKDAWNTSKYLNLWCCNLGTSLLGYAQFPGGPAATDGVVINYRYFGRGYASVAPFNKGRTGTHEVGHWLNLRHIWGDASCGNDYVTDTPTQQTSNYGCPSYPRTTCSNGSAGDQFMNYMDYTDDACMNMFSAGQKTRMRALFASTGARYSLLSSGGCGSGTTPTTCGVPANLSATSITTSSATLNWGSVSGASSYSVRYKALSSTTWNTSTTTSLSRAISGLTAGTTYEFQVSATCSGGSSSYSVSKQFATTSTSGTTTSTLTIGTGTSQSLAPYGTYYMDQKSQFIITKTELTNAGFTSTKNVLKSLAFNVVTNAGKAMSGFSIKIRHTTAAAFSSGFLSATNMVTVYSGTFTPVAGWNTHNFTTPFTYNGVDHLLVEICWDNSSYTTDTKVYGTSLSTYNTIQKQQDVSAGGICATTTGSLSYVRPNMRLTFGSSTSGARTTAVEEVQAPVLSVFNLYPNPAKDLIYVDYSLVNEASAAELEVYNMMGQKVVSSILETSVGEHNVKIDLNSGMSLPSGMYILNLVIDGQRQTKRFIISE